MANIFNGFFDNLFNGATNPKGNLADYQHAARLYIDNNMRLSPKFKHLYHVVLNINPSANIAAITNNTKLEINLLAKNADLPKYRIQTQVVNQYNRKKNIQTGVEYQPATIEFHDDNAGLTTLLWEAYFRYYYADSDYTSKNADGTPKLTADGYNRIEGGLNNTYGSQDATRFRYGLDKSNKRDPFFSSIQVFQLHPQNMKSTYTSFTLINPIIEQFEHDTVDQTVSELTMNRLVVSYESVQYGRGYTANGNAPTGFADVHYDKMPSPISIQGGASPGNIFGQAGVIAGIDNSINAFKNGNILGGLISSANTLKNINNLNKANLIKEGTTLLENLAIGTINNINFPNSNKTNTTTVATQRTFDGR